MTRITEQTPVVIDGHIFCSFAEFWQSNGARLDAKEIASIRTALETTGVYRGGEVTVALTERGEGWTKGPWHAESGHEASNGLYWQVHDGFDAVMNNSFCHTERCKHEANAHLIAAALDLYASLKEIVDEWGCPNTLKWLRARAALARARGEQP